MLIGLVLFFQTLRFKKRVDEITALSTHRDTLEEQAKDTVKKHKERALMWIMIGVCLLSVAIFI